MCDHTFANQLKEWRHYLHMYPETAFEEKITSAFIAEKLSAMGLEVHTKIGGTGVVASLKAGDGNEVVGLRADMDCIYINETTGLPYQSKHAGKMHACGHDGHVVTLLGAAMLLCERKNFNGTVRFIFQPAEEPGTGAPAMLADGLLERFPMDEIYGFHNMPSFPAGTAHMRTGGIMASEDNFVIGIKGRGSHASAPHLSIDPLVTAAEIILALQTIVSRSLSPALSGVVSCTEIFTDGAHNAIPTNAKILGDTRSFDPQVQALIETKMREISESICRMNGAECEFKYTHEFTPTINWEKCVNVAAMAARKILGAENVDANCAPWMGSEDFGAFLQEIPGCYFFLGTGEHENPADNIPPHNSAYDYNDDMLETGAQLFAELIATRLK